jgi:hypothetical protein
MKCLHPINAYRSITKTALGKRAVVFKPQQGYSDMPITIPCGQCIACRLEYSRRWAVRIMHEAQMHDNNTFITLTYNNENLPKNQTLVLDDVQKFYKRLRKKIQPTKIRYFNCGEYGEKFGRPHYHSIIFGYDFPDKTILKKLPTGHIIYDSALLKNTWTHGNVAVGSVTFESSAYVARYILKKITGDKAIDYYYDIDYDTGELLSERRPEFVNMSRRSGIGKTWYDKYKDDVYPHDKIHMRGSVMMPPPFYDKILEKENPELYREIKIKREIQAMQDNTSYKDLMAKQLILEKRIDNLIRPLEKILKIN